MGYWWNSQVSWQVSRVGAGVGHPGPWLECRGSPGRPRGQNSGGSGSVCGEAPVPPSPSSVCSHGHGSPVCDRLVMVSESAPSSTSLEVWSLRPVCASLSQTSEEIFQHLQNIVDFGKNVMKEFLGENYVHCGVSGFHVCSLSSWVQSVSVTSQLSCGTLYLMVSPHVSYRLSKCFSHLLNREVTEQIVFFPFSS